jgi:dienelactone hydrolase
MSIKMSSWLAAVPLTVSMLGAVSSACAQLVLVSQSGTASAVIQDRASASVLQSDVKTWPAGDLSPLTLTAQTSSGSHTAQITMSSTLTANSLQAHMNLVASFQQPDQTQTATASGDMAVFFDLTKPSLATFQFAGGTGGNATASPRLYAVNNGVEAEVTLSNTGATANASLPAGHYVFRGKGASSLGAWFARGSNTGLQGASFDYTLTVSEANPLWRGPYPDDMSVLQARGPFTVASAKIASPVGFGGGTVYYPSATTEGPFALVTITPGVLEKQSAINWLGPRLASQGFVVVTIDTKSLLDSAASRTAQTKAAVAQVLSLNGNAAMGFAGRIDPARVGLMGHSTGNSLDTALAFPQALASIPLAPSSTKSDYSATTVPTMIVSCQKDAVSPVKTNANKFYDSLSATLPKALAEIKGGSHTCTNSSTSAANQQMIGKYTLSWLKRFLDQDTRYSLVLCQPEPRLDLLVSPTALSAYKSNCPY